MYLYGLLVFQLQKNLEHQVFEILQHKLADQELSQILLGLSLIHI